MAAFDEIGYWSEIKLDILREYATAYSTILTARRFTHFYIDAFAGSGTHFSRTTGGMVAGSPLNALAVRPPFHEFHFVDIDGNKVAELRRAVGTRSDVWIYEGDCNEILLKDVLPRVKYSEFKRALCLLDPYGLHLDWTVIETAGRMGTVDLFLNFPTMDMNMNVLWSDPDRPAKDQRDRMNRFWGDESWRNAAYNRNLNLLGMELKVPGANEAVVSAFRERLRAVAEFETVPEPLPMRNSTGAIVYYLVFASQKPVAAGIVEDIFKKYRARVS